MAFGSKAIRFFFFFIKDIRLLYGHGKSLQSSPILLKMIYLRLIDGGCEQYEPLK